MLYTINSPKLRFDTVPEQLSTISDLLKNNKVLEINLKNVTDIDSAAIAMLIELKNIANTNGTQISFVNSSQDVLRLCKLYCINL
ncbi:MAG: STAS domain-containing protein [Burkholderiales bacterium]|nr:STAS domain-containing protein [Burkholderiales bacterium]